MKRSELFWLGLVALALIILAIALTLTDPLGNAVLRQRYHAQHDSLAQLHRDVATLQRANAHRQQVIDSIAATNQALLTSERQAGLRSDSLRRALAATPRPVLTDTTSPRWFHRSLFQDTVIALDSLRIDDLHHVALGDSAGFALYRAQHLADSTMASRAILRADSLAGLAAIAVSRDGCRIARVLPCPGRKWVFLAGVASGIELSRKGRDVRALARQLVPP